MTGVAFGVVAIACYLLWSFTVSSSLQGLQCWASQGVLHSAHVTNTRRTTSMQARNWTCTRLQLHKQLAMPRTLSMCNCLLAVYGCVQKQLAQRSDTATGHVYVQLQTCSVTHMKLTHLDSIVVEYHAPLGSYVTYMLHTRLAWQSSVVRRPKAPLRDNRDL